MPPASERLSPAAMSPARDISVGQSTCILPSLDWARWAKISRMSWERSMILQVVASESDLTWADSIRDQRPACPRPTGAANSNSSSLRAEHLRGSIACPPLNHFSWTTIPAELASSLNSPSILQRPLLSLVTPTRIARSFEPSSFETRGFAHSLLPATQSAKESRSRSASDLGGRKA